MITIAKKTTVILILIMLNLSVLSGCTGRQEGTVKVDDSVLKKSNSGFEVYLVKEGQQALSDDIKIDQLILEDTPLISKTDIASYHWDLHTLKLKNNKTITKDLLQKSFVVTADGERMYKGTFWSCVFSMVPPKAALYLDNLVEDDDYIFLPLGRWGIGREINPDGEHALSDKKIKNVLKRDGLLHNPYQCVHFKRPQYITILDQGNTIGFTRVDWEKKDQLLKLLDGRFLNRLEYIDLKLSQQDKMTLNAGEIIIKLVYEEPHVLELNSNIDGEDKKLLCKDIYMPLTGEYNDLMFVENDDVVNAIGKLKKLQDKDIEQIKSKFTPYKSTEFKEPQGMSLTYYTGKPFEPISYNFYELNTEEVNKIKEAAALFKTLKDKPEPEKDAYGLPLSVHFGKDDARWFYIYNNRRTIFTKGKYYDNPKLSKVILDIAREKCGFEMFDTSVFTGIVKIKYSFRTNTRTFECSTEDKDIINKIENGLQKANHHRGSGCPFSDGVLTLTFENGKTMNISMASDDCPLMFIDGNYLRYSDELRNLFEKTFNNFPYVRN